MSEKISSNVRNRRLELKLTIAEAARKTSCSVRTYQRYEQKEFGFTTDQMETILKSFGMTWQELLRGVIEDPPDLSKQQDIVTKARASLAEIEESLRKLF